MAIADDFTIDYAAQTIKYTGGFTNGIPDSIYTANAWYTYLMDTFDELGQMDDPIPVEAKTPTEYVLLWPWFMEDNSFKALYEGSIRTSGWDRVTGTATGIVQVEYSGTPDPVAGDIGKPIVHETDSDSGVLLDFDTTRNMLWIRPDSNAAANNFDSTSGNLDVTGGTQNIVQSEASVDGEAVWYNIYTLGTIEPDMEIYVVQVNDFTEVATPALTKLSAWWNEDVDFTAAEGVEAGHVDLLIKIQEVGTLIDDGYLLVMGRQYSKTYSHFQLIGTGAGRAAVPLSTGDDLDNETGNRQVAVTSASGNYTVGEVITGGTSGAEGIVTAETGDPTTTLFYYLIDDLTDFTNTETITGAQSSVTSTSGTPADSGPALDTDITVTFGDTQQDINNGNGSREYSVIVNVNSNTLAEAYERVKHLTRRGQTGDIDSGAQTIVGEFYTGVGDIYLAYDNGSQDDPFNDGEVITGGTSTATGIVTARHDTGASVGFLAVRQVRGTFQNNEQITGGTSGHTADVNGAPSAWVSPQASPFGTFAGGTFFGARGVFLQNVQGGEANNYQLIDSNGVVQVPPQTVAIEVTGLKQYDRVAVYRLVAQGGAINKDEFSGMAATSQSLSVINVGAAIGSDHPTSGVVTVVAVDEDEEHQYRYTSFSGTQFTLSTGVSGTADTGGSATRLVDSAVNFLSGDIEIGDMIRNITDGEYAWVVKIVDADNIDTTPLPTGSWDSGDTYESNQTVIAYDTSDDVYVPFILVAREADGDESTTITYSADIYATVRVRQSTETGGGARIVPYIAPMTIGSGGGTSAAIRTLDEIIT